MSKIKITINSKQYDATPEQTVLEVAQQNNIQIPTLCHDPRLKPFSSCYLCVVEIEGAKGLQTSCSTKATDGMKVVTDNEKIRQSRKTALDLLLSNHYADCSAPCRGKCPAGVDIQGYIALIEKGMFHEAIALIKQTNPLPAICGRVCVRPCEVACNRNYMDEGAAVGIDYMKRYAADADLNSDNHFIPEIAPSTGKKIAVIGAGPGGLSAAYFLQQKGHQVDIFEANNHAGGWLRYGIPEYRLPNDLLDAEISTITELGVNIHLNKNFGHNLSYKELQNDYNSTILTIGSQRGTLLRAPGEEAEGVYSGIDFLRNMEQTGQKYDFKGKKVVVVGGGNTAMDCCRTAVRCNADKVYVVYRRTEKEMPANPIEIHESKLEGVEYLLLTNPSRVNSNENGKVKSITCIRMELGEPDASGRRSPVPVNGSDFDLEVDVVLAAIGQKTDINFLDDINKYATNGQLKPNKWGDIDADPITLQTGIPSVFAAGDGVTGPATIIEAIAQAKVASRSCHQYLMGEELHPEPKEFLSKKSNFKKVVASDFRSKFAPVSRKEMPVLTADSRLNFVEVELGYGEEDAIKETQRCFECGCVEYYTCDLKEYSTEYGVEQKKYEGDFNEYKTDFSHPYIEIDNNKCILCSRCIRICDEVVGASALGLVERGFDTFVAPSLGDTLNDTNCESCGLCISTCPTAAITENFDFKPGPLLQEKFTTISNFGSAGESINVNHNNGFVMQITGAEGQINPETNICRQAKFGYQYLNDNSRITKPLLKSDEGGFKEITYDEAFDIIKDKVAAVEAKENALFAGARLTNEEQFLINKLAVDGIKTENTGSFHYLGRGNGYQNNSFKNVPFEQIKDAGKIYILGNSLLENDGFVNYLVNNARAVNGLEVIYICTDNDKYSHKADTTVKVTSYYWFTKAVAAFIAENGLQNQLFINDNCTDFEAYKKALTPAEEYAHKAGIDMETVEAFANSYNKENNAIILFSEKTVSANCSKELFNLAMITGKLGKTASGLIVLKENNNSHGLLDNVKHSPILLNNLISESIKNYFIFGEDPIGCAMNVDEIAYLKNADFIVVQDAFMTNTAKVSDLILPASLHTETIGSYTNTQRVIQCFEAGFEPETELQTYEQLIQLLNLFGVEGIAEIENAFDSAIAELPEYNNKLQFEITDTDNNNRLFDYGCDYIVKRFEEEFEGKKY